MKERLGELKEELYGERRAGKEALREVRRCERRRRSWWRTWTEAMRLEGTRGES